MRLVWGGCSCSRRACVCVCVCLRARGLRSPSWPPLLCRAAGRAGATRAPVSRWSCASPRRVRVPRVRERGPWPPCVAPRARACVDERGWRRARAGRWPGRARARASARSPARGWGGRARARARAPPRHRCVRALPRAGFARARARRTHRDWHLAWRRARMTCACGRGAAFCRPAHRRASMAARRHAAGCARPGSRTRRAVPIHRLFVKARRSIVVCTHTHSHAHTHMGTRRRWCHTAQRSPH